MHLPRHAVAVAAALALAGCASSVDIATTWSFHTVAGGPDSGCPGDTAIVSAQRIDADIDKIGEPITHSYACADEEGDATFDPGLYLFSVAIPGYATSAPVLVNTSADDTDALATFVTDGGVIALSWDLVDAQTDQTSTCADAGMEDTGGISAVITDGTGATVATDLLRCRDHFGVTDPLLPGTYTVTLTAEAAQPVGMPTTATATVTAPNGIADLGWIAIPIDGVEGDPH